MAYSKYWTIKIASQEHSTQQSYRSNMKDKLRLSQINKTESSLPLDLPYKKNWKELFKLKQKTKLHSTLIYRDRHKGRMAEWN